MNFISNKITNPTGNGITFDEWLQKQLKVASEAKPGTGLDMKGEPRGQQRGQVINNDNEDGSDSYQKGESVDGKKDQSEGKSKKESKSTAVQKEAVCGKEMGESNDAGKVTEKHTEAAPGDDENKEPKVLINNDPNYQKGESTKPGKAKGKSKKASTQKFKKIASLDRKDKLTVFASLYSHKNPIEYVEAMTGIKVANLTSEEKEWFKKYWGIIFPEEYVTEMVKDK